MKQSGSIFRQMMVVFIITVQLLTSQAFGILPDQNLDQINQQLALLNQNMATSNTNWAASNGNWQTTNTELGNISSKWESTNGYLSQVTQHWGQTNDMLQRLSNPTNLFLGGAAAGIGMALGGGMISIGVYVLKTTAEAIYEACTHEIRNSKLLEEFQKAKEEFPKVNSIIDEIEGRIDTFTYIQSEVNRVGGNYNFLVELNLEIFRLEILSTNLKELNKNLRWTYDLITQSTPQFTEVSQQVHAQLKEAINRLDLVGAKQQIQYRDLVKLREAFEKLKDKDICAKLKGDIGLLIQAENDLQGIRLVLSDPLREQVWEQAWNARGEESRNSATRLQDETSFNALFSEEEEAAKKTFKSQFMSDPVLKDLMYQAWYDCLAKSGSILARIPFLRVLSWVDDYGVRKRCWRKAKTSNSDLAKKFGYSDTLRPMESARDKTLEDIQKRKSSRKTAQAAKWDPELDAQALISYHRFFEKLRQDQQPSVTRDRLIILLEKEEKIKAVCGS